MSGPVKHHANSYASSALASSLALHACPNLVKLITTGFIFLMEKLQLDTIWMLHTEHCPPDEQMTATSSCGEGSYLLPVAPAAEAIAQFSVPPSWGGSSRARLPVSITKTILTGSLLKYFCADPLLLRAISGCILQITFSHILTEATTAKFHPACSKSGQRFPVTENPTIYTKAFW